MSKQCGAYKVALAASDAAGGILAITNPEGADLIVTKLTLNVTTVATGACTVDAGITTNGTTKVDNLIDGLDVHTAAGAFADLGTNGKRAKLWTANQYLTVSMATGAAAGLKGNAYIEYIRV